MTQDPRSKPSPSVNAFRLEAPLEFAKTKDAQQSDTKSRPIQMLARTKKVIDHWWWGRCVHDFAGMVHADRIILDYCHSSEDIIGFADEFIVDDSGLTLRGRVESIEENDEAEKMLLRLSGFLRHAIDSDTIQKSTLGKEANMQREYLGIEAARFGDKLRCHCDLPAALHDCMVPSLLLQPIVENAIKYAVAPANRTSHIWLGGRAENGRLILYVEDDGPGIDPNRARKEGVGWSNTRDRLATLYGGGAEMRIMKGTRGGGVLVELDMPLERG